MENQNQKQNIETDPLLHSMRLVSSRRNTGLLRTTIASCLLVITLTISACASTAGTPAATTAPVSIAAQPSTAPATSTPQPTPTSVPTATNAPQPAASTALDPCQLISSQEASTLANASFGSGKEVVNPNGLKSCTYKAQPSTVFIVEVTQAPSLEAAKADKDQFLADLQANAQQISSEGLNVTQLPNFADGAITTSASVSAGGVTVSGSAFGFLKGTIFVGFSDTVIGSGAAPTSDAMQAEATTLLGRLP